MLCLLHVVQQGNNTNEIQAWFRGKFLAWQWKFYDALSISCIGARMLALLVSTIHPFMTISSSMKCAFSRWNMMSSSHCKFRQTRNKRNETITMTCIIWTRMGKIKTWKIGQKSFLIISWEDLPHCQNGGPWFRLTDVWTPESQVHSAKNQWN